MVSNGYWSKTFAYNSHISSDNEFCSDSNADEDFGTVSVINVGVSKNSIGVSFLWALY